MKHLSPDDIDALLPQTQCGLCTHQGCMPYAEAIVYENAPINLCPPGGVNTLKALGALVDQDVTPYLAEMAGKSKPKMKAVIREADCIGCTKCIPACPVDAIIGSAKQMHTVISDECTGCELCIAPCPVDCIDLITLPEDKTDITAEAARKALSRTRFQAKTQRQEKEHKAKLQRRQAQSIQEKRKYIMDAVSRAKMKRAES